MPEDRPESPFAYRVRCELDSARQGHAKLNSLHEGYAVILEEVDELWDEVRKRRQLRNKKLLLNELVQVAAMCQRLAEDLDLIEGEST